MTTPVRPGPSPTASPRTPQRGISSTFSSPGSFRAEEDAVIFEIGSRYLRAGYAGDSAPKCTLGFGPEESRRVGDYRRWLPGYEERAITSRKLEDWGRDHELWHLDLREADLDLIETKVERAVRGAYSKFLLLDSKSKKAILVVPSVMPHQLLSALLSVLFSNFQMPSIALLPPPTMSAVAAGQRSGLVVDIGWHETIITPVYELRETSQHRTVRGMKLVLYEAGKLFQRSLNPNLPAAENDEHKMTLDFAYVEELVTRMIWCKTSSTFQLESGIANLEIQDATRQSSQDNAEISIPLPRSTDRPIRIPFLSLSKPIEQALFADSKAPRKQDDQEHPLHYLIYEALVSLPGDTRAACMSRVMFTGGGANTPGLKTRLMNELTSMAEARGWDPVWGRAADEQRRRKAERAKQSSNESNSREGERDGMHVNGEPKEGVAFEGQVPDPIEQKIRQQDAKGKKPSVSGVVRGLETLGPWAGASLTAALKVKSAVEIDRDIFLQYGLSGSKRLSDVNPARPKSNTGALPKTLGTAESGGWTLGAWA